MKQEYKTAVEKIRNMAFDSGYEFRQLRERAWKIGTPKNDSHIKFEYFPDWDNLERMGMIFINDEKAGDILGIDIVTGRLLWGV